MESLSQRICRMSRLRKQWPALRSSPAPVLVAKGQGAFAEEIIAVAKSAGVHLAEDPVLAETLSYLQLQQEIPEDVYVAVATVLAWAYWLKGEAPQVLTER